MKTAVNYSPQAAALVKDGLLDLDCFKSHTDQAWLAEALETGPAYVHLPIHADDPDLPEQPWEMFDQMVEATGTKWINVHLTARRSHFEGDGWGPVRARWLSNLAWLSDRYGKDRIIAENTVSRGNDPKWLPCSVVPHHIEEVLEESGCWLLLDIAHARICSLEIGEEPFKRLRAMPLHRLKDLHVSGVQFHEGRWRDSMAMTEGDWEAMEWLATCIMIGKAGRPEMASLEYGGLGPLFDWRSDPAEIHASVNRLRGLGESL